MVWLYVKQSLFNNCYISYDHIQSAYFAAYLIWLQAHANGEQEEEYCKKIFQVS